LGSMLVVVAADADDLRPRDHGREQCGVGQRDPLPRRLEPREHGVAGENDEITLVDDAVPDAFAVTETRDLHPHSLARASAHSRVTGGRRWCLSTPYRRSRWISNLAG